VRRLKLLSRWDADLKRMSSRWPSAIRRRVGSGLLRLKRKHRYGNGSGAAALPSRKRCNEVAALIAACATGHFSGQESSAGLRSGDRCGPDALAIEGLHFDGDGV
jgi:hypothetical protein